MVQDFWHSFKTLSRTITGTARNFSLSYSPDMDWNKEYGDFISDKACIGAYKVTGRKIPVNMIPEWKWTKGIIPEGGDPG